MKKKIAIIGNFGDTSKITSDGQTIKTRIVTNELIKQFGEESIITFNTFGGIKKIFSAPIMCIRAMYNASNVIILPAHNGVRVFAPLLYLFSFLIRNRRLHYCVIGGWLPYFIKNKPFLTKSLKTFHSIYVETNTMKKDMEHMQFHNVLVMSNFKNLNIVESDQLDTNHCEPYRLCSFSRVNKEKGIGDAVEIIQEINKKYNRIVFSYDIYGKVDPLQLEWFENIKNNFPDYITYKGVVDFKDSVTVLKQYYALLFPTRYFTEGIPGTIIDAYAAGLPVISARWLSCSDIIEDGVTGLCYDFNNLEQLKQILEDIIQSPENISKLKNNCLLKATQYVPNKAIFPLIKNLL